MIIYPDEMFAVVLWEKGKGDLFATFHSEEHAKGMARDIKRNTGTYCTVIRVAVKIDDARQEG